MKLIRKKPPRHPKAPDASGRKPKPSRNGKALVDAAGLSPYRDTDLVADRCDMAVRKVEYDPLAHTIVTIPVRD